MDKQRLRMDVWIRMAVPCLSGVSFSESRLKDVTLLAYFFWDDDRIETRFYTVECAFLCAFYRYGLMPSVLVVNKRTKRMEEFCGRYSIKIDVDPTLTGGVPRMNIDCNSNLYKRFETDYVLAIQSDGMAVSPGLEEFVGKYDYIGAPWVPHVSWKRHLPYAKYLVGNSGFCLRSKRLCRRVSELYNRWFSGLPFNWFLNDDVFSLSEQQQISAPLKLPKNLVEDLQNPELTWIIFINPPYATSNSDGNILTTIKNSETKYLDMNLNVDLVWDLSQIASIESQKNGLNGLNVQQLCRC